MRSGMVSAVARHVLRAVAIVLAVASASFFLLLLAPGDFVQSSSGFRADLEQMAQERAALGLDRSIPSQYLEWLGQLVRLNWGTSWLYQRPVFELVLERTLNTVFVAVLALIGATCVGFAAGTWRAITQRRRIALLLDSVSATLVSLPALFVTLVLAFAGARTGWYSVGAQPPNWQELTDFGSLADALARAVLPVIAMMLPIAATLERLQARALSEALAAPFHQGLSARGLSPARAAWLHAARFAAAPVVAVYGYVAANLMNGSLTVELFLGWPGLGRLLIDGLSSRDRPLVSGCVLAGTGIVIACLTITRAVAGALDPRVSVATEQESRL